MYAKRPRKVCLCKGVSREEIILAIQEGATSLKKIAQKTSAMTSCGTCLYDVEDILAEEKKKLEDRKIGQANFFSQ